MKRVTYEEALARLRTIPVTEIPEGYAGGIDFEEWLRSDEAKDYYMLNTVHVSKEVALDFISDDIGLKLLKFTHDNFITSRDIKLSLKIETSQLKTENFNYENIESIEATLNSIRNKLASLSTITNIKSVEYAYSLTRDTCPEVTEENGEKKVSFIVLGGIETITRTHKFIIKE